MDQWKKFVTFNNNLVLVPDLELAPDKKKTKKNFFILSNIRAGGGNTIHNGKGRYFHNYGGKKDGEINSYQEDSLGEGRFNLYPVHGIDHT